MLRHLREKVYCRLAPSSVHGVGVFAVRSIPAGTDPFQLFMPSSDLQRCDLSDAQLRREGVGEPVVALVHDFFVPNGDRRRSYPVCDPNQLNISFYLNHGGRWRANMKFAECAEHEHCAYDHVVASRDIGAGEELLLDYHAEGFWPTIAEEATATRERAAQ